MEVISPSPEASSLIKYAEMPVSYFYGLPIIDLPLYSIPVDQGLNINVSVSYHGGGVRAGDVASRIGLGWSLNGGGVISRTVRGLPDEVLIGNFPVPTDYNAVDLRKRGYFNLSVYDKSTIEYLKNKGFDYYPLWYGTDFQEENLSKLIRLYNNYMGGYMDSSQDIYSFNFLGINGSFMMPTRDSVVVQTDAPVDVSVTNFPYGGFRIKDNKGNTYYFEELEYSKHPYETNFYSTQNNFVVDTVQYVSGWYLNKIITAEGDSVIYKYTEMPQIKGNPSVFSSFTYCNVVIDNKDGTYQSLINGGLNMKTQSSIYSPKRLDEIATKELDIRIVSSPIERKDLKGDKTTIDSLIVTNKLENVLKRYKFHTSYFNDDYALRLDSIIELSTNNGNNSFIPLYRFTYDDFNNPAEHNIYSVDHWGYFNNSEANCLIPHPVDYAYSGDNFADRNTYSANRFPGTLTSIQYPTGGKTFFEWETNTYSYLPDSIQVQNTGYEHNNYVYDTLNGINDQNYRKVKLSISILKPQVIKFFFHQYYLGLGEFMSQDLVPNYFPSYYQNHPDDSGINEIPTVCIYKRESQDSILESTFYLDDKTIRSEFSNKDQATSLYLESGDYDIILKNPTGGMLSSQDEKGMLDIFSSNGLLDIPPTYGYFSIKYANDSKTNSGPKYAGGLRIRRIRSLNRDDEIDRLFLYHPQGYPDISSGVIVQEPSYDSKYYVFYNEETDAAGVAVRMLGGEVNNTYSDGLYKVAAGNLPSVEYSRVSEIFTKINRDSLTWIYEGHANDKRIDYTYSTVMDNSPISWDQNENRAEGYQPNYNLYKTSRTYYRGNLMSVDYFDPNASCFKAKIEKYEYKIDMDNKPHFFTGDLFMIADWSRVHASIPKYQSYGEISYDYGINKFQMTPYSKNVLSKSVFLKNTSLNDTLITETKYKYISPIFCDGQADVTNSIPIAVETTNSSGDDEIIYKTYYKKTDKVETEVKTVGNYIIEANKYEYDPQTLTLRNTYTALLPEDGTPISSLFKLGTGYNATDALKNFINTLEYSYTYDKNNKPLEVYYKGMIKSSYIWAYNDSHPIAEIKKKTAVEVDELLSSVGTTREQLLTSFNPDKEKLLNMQKNNADVHMTIFEYEWMFGILSSTSEKGITTYYNYDEFGRLKAVKDNDLNYLKYNEYNYKN